MAAAVKRPLRVAFIMGKMHSGGKKTLAMQYFLHFDKKLVDVTFVVDSDSNATPIKEIEDFGGHVVSVAPYQDIFKNMKDMRRVFDAGCFDVAHAFNSTMNVFSLRVAEQAGIPVRISESLSMAHKDEPKTKLKLLLRRFSKKHVTHYVSCGEDCGRWQFGDALYDAGEVDVFKTAIDSPKYAWDPELRGKVREELGIAPDALVVGFIGRFAYQKNPMFLVEVFRELVRVEPAAILLLIGDGDYRDQMLKYICDEGIEENVIYLGRREDIVGFYQAMDCFLLPSFYEGLPVVGLEAQCAGLHVFFSDEITPEASFCELGHFETLADGADLWARSIKEAMVTRGARCSHVNECIAAGFDATAEAKRLQRYYENAYEQVGGHR